MLDSLIPGTRQQVVNKGVDVGDADIVIAIAISSSQVNARLIAAQQIVDQSRHIVDVHATVTIHVTAQAGVLCGEVARVARAAVDVGIVRTHVASVVGRALTTHQAGAVIEH